ncbi:hypothetical protein F4778DRAFT_786792 [Xylariomycetidae sp. FL2044]|nr:hypothetical protein F4778DRAFT_786792 [Xylariomycetidae sp. FL2044]
MQQALPLTSSSDHKDKEVIAGLKRVTLHIENNIEGVSNHQANTRQSRLPLSTQATTTTVGEDRMQSGTPDKSGEGLDKIGDNVQTEPRSDMHIAVERVQDETQELTTKPSNVPDLSQAEDDSSTPHKHPLPPPPPPLEKIETLESDLSRPPVTAVQNPTVPPKFFTLRQISQHNSPVDMWLVIDNDVYDVTEFQFTHPGGSKILASVAGKDATKKFDKYHRRGILERYKKDLCVGVLDYNEATTNTRRGWLKKLGLGKGKGKGSANREEEVEKEKEKELRRLNTV